MSVSSRTRVLLLAFAAALTLPATVPVAQAADPSCVQACAEGWIDDKQECDDRRAWVHADIERQVEECISECQPGSYLCQGMCTRNGEIRRRAYENQYRRCLNVANTTAWNCYRDCTISRSRP